MKNFPNYKDIENSDSGPACLKLISKYYKKYYEISYIKDLFEVNQNGSFEQKIIGASEKIGLNAYSSRIEPITLFKKVKFPCILYWDNTRYIIMYKLKKEKVYISDPKLGLIKYSKNEFIKGWLNNDKKGLIIILEPTHFFYDLDTKKVNVSAAIRLFFSYLRPYKNNVIQLLIVMFIITFVMILLPFVTRSIIDIGIQTNDLDFIKILLIANLALIFFKSIGQWVKSSISLHLGSRIKISLINDYLLKLLKLPISFFESKLIGDIIQRARDQQRIQSFITNSAISVFLSFLLLLGYSVILSFYNIWLFLIFISLTIIYIIWVVLFYNIRKKMDIKYFELIGQNQSQWIEIMTGIIDIKNNNYENTMRLKWGKTQVGLYDVGLKLLNVDQTQQLGAEFINGIKNMGLTFFSAILVIRGEISIGTMIAIQFIIGQLALPVQEIITFIQSMQMAYISYLRISEVNQVRNEEERDIDFSFFPKNKTIKLEDVSFGYSPRESMVIKNVSILIPENKTTAIVGKSGSGKSTLLKLLMRNHNLTYGNIYVGKTNINNIDITKWRNSFGSVTQDSKIFNETILNNIVLNDGYNYNREKLETVIKIVNLHSDIKNFKNGIYTQMKEINQSLSSGQKQKILIARALYKDSDYLFFDEATNSLDSYTEKLVNQNLKNNNKNKTTIVIAHRLSTVKDADQIIVIDNGRIVEVGNHDFLINKKHYYYKLFSDQILFEKSK